MFKNNVLIYFAHIQENPCFLGQPALAARHHGRDSAIPRQQAQRDLPKSPTYGDLMMRILALAK
jgi:hypothetical protein